MNSSNNESNKLNETYLNYEINQTTEIVLNLNTDKVCSSSG